MNVVTRMFTVEQPAAVVPVALTPLEQAKKKVLMTRAALDAAREELRSAFQKEERLRCESALALNELSRLMQE